MKSPSKSRQTHLRLQRDRRTGTKTKPHRAAREPLPDYPPQRGGILLVGTCSIASVAKTGHYFQGAYGKRVWKKLAHAGLLRNASPGEEDEAWVLAGHGVTDIVKRAPRSNDDLKPAEIAAGVDAFREKVKKWSPRVIVFAFKNAAFAVLGVRDLEAGPGPSFLGFPTQILTGPYAKPADAEAEAARLARL